MTRKHWKPPSKWRKDAEPSIPTWKEGMIAFLHDHKKNGGYCPEDTKELITSRYLPGRVTGHPVVVLQRPSPRSTHVLITTVSAYGVRETDPRPPWTRRDLHIHEPGQPEAQPEDFRSFMGSELVKGSYPPLRLTAGTQFPKPTTSWVCIQNAWVVPTSVLGVFYKKPMPKGLVLEMRPESLGDLRRHMADKCRVWADRQAHLLATETARLSVSDAPAPAAAGPSSWATRAPAALPSAPASAAPPRSSPASATPASASATASSTPSSFAAALRARLPLSAPVPTPDLSTPWSRPAQKRPGPVRRVPEWEAKDNWRQLD